MTSRERNRDDWDWSLSFSSLFHKIEHWLILIVLNISCILVLLCLWPCIMAMIRRALKSSLSMIMKGYYVAQARLRRQDDHEPECRLGPLSFYFYCLSLVRCGKFTAKS